ncbi:MAG: GGDEF domain-containing phosphodiesterase [Bacilli bacterium]|nr:GGDEF domain-containing phosphodiesterase [Bacilli bacterium]
MVNALKKFLLSLRDVLGLHHNSKYVKKYLNDANMRSGVYMAGIIVLLEIWLVIRQFQKYISKIFFSDVEKYVKTFEAFGHNHIRVIFAYTSSFWLLMFFGMAMFFYCLFITSKRNKILKKHIVPTLVFAGISLAVSCLLPFEFKAQLPPNVEVPDQWLKDLLMILLYVSVILTDVSIIIATIYKYKGGKNQIITSILVVSFFALTCLSFGVKVSYSDFASMKEVSQDGVYVLQINKDYKQIICFLMMSIYVACLLIWKPYVSFGILGFIFLGFYLLLKKYAGNLDGYRKFPDGDEVNYITFFISLTMICISIYDQRVREARKDEELERLATQDTLTNLYSFEYFVTLITKMADESFVKLDKWIYLFLDITSFKIFNDQKGFAEGNAFLKAVGDILIREFPETLISRQSDDHFVLFTANENIESRLERVNSLIEQLDLDIKPRIKVGGYIYRDPNEDPHQSLEKARYACAVIKRDVNHRFMLYDQEMHDNYRLVQYIVRHIDEAVENGYIKAYYQPVVWSKDKTLCGAEALARWIDPKYGFLSPAKFVPALEKAQLIYKLDIAVLRIVCRDLRYNLDHKLPVIPVSINFSRLDFVLLDIVKEIDDTVQEFNIPKDLLHVEITESALMDDRDILKTAIDNLHEKGYAVWLDDFGSGYSSFNVLKDFEFDVLKLDMEFLKNYNGSKKTKSLIESVVKMADSIGMKTLSEGVETSEEADFLKSIQCGRLQGYLFGKPLSYDELKAKIENKEIILSKEIY